MAEPREKRTEIPVIDEWQAALQGEIDLFDRTLSEKQTKEFLPQLLLGDEEGISAPEMSSAISITPEAVLRINQTEIQVEKPGQFKGTVTLSVDLFNQRPGILAARDLNVEVEGGNMIKRAAVRKMMSDSFRNPQEPIEKRLEGQVARSSGGTHRLEKFEAQINPNKSLRIILRATSTR